MYGSMTMCSLEEVVLILSLSDRIVGFAEWWTADGGRSSWSGFCVHLLSIAVNFQIFGPGVRCMGGLSYRSVSLQPCSSRVKCAEGGYPYPSLCSHFPCFLFLLHEFQNVFLLMDIK